MKKSQSKLIALVLLATPVLGGWTLFGSPKIDVTCELYGTGAGSCTFTNSGDGAGTECGKIVVTNPRNKETMPSQLYCSGKLEPSSSVSINVSAPTNFWSECRGCSWSWEKE